METQTKINTDASEMWYIEDVKDEPNLKQAQEFVGGMVECLSLIHI